MTIFARSHTLRCIDKLYNILPKLARKKMDKILKECHANKTR